MFVIKYTLHVVLLLTCLHNVELQQCTDQLDCLRRISSLLDILVERDSSFDLAKIRLYIQSIYENGVAQGPLIDYNQLVLDYYTGSYSQPRDVICLSKDCTDICVIGRRAECCFTEKGDICECQTIWHTHYRARPILVGSEIVEWLKKSTFEHDPNFNCCGTWDPIELKCFRPCLYCMEAYPPPHPGEELCSNQTIPSPCTPYRMPISGEEARIRIPRPRPYV